MVICLTSYGWKKKTTGASSQLGGRNGTMSTSRHKPGRWKKHTKPGSIWRKRTKTNDLAFPKKTVFFLYLKTVKKHINPHKPKTQPGQWLLCRYLSSRYGNVCRKWSILLLVSWVSAARKNGGILIRAEFSSWRLILNEIWWGIPLKEKRLLDRKGKIDAWPIFANTYSKGFGEVYQSSRVTIMTISMMMMMMMMLLHEFVACRTRFRQTGTLDGDNRYSMLAQQIWGGSRLEQRVWMKRGKASNAEKNCRKNVLHLGIQYKHVMPIWKYWSI